MAWTDEQWAMFSNILRRGFAARDPFTDNDADVYRLLLDGVDPESAMRAVKELVLAGQALRPKPGEIVARAQSDPSMPTFDEAYRLIYGTGGILAATPHRASGVLTYASEAERCQLYAQAAADRAAGLHPLVAAFVERQGIGRLREIGVNDPDYGELRRKELRAAWDQHVEAFAGRDTAALAAGASRSELGMRQFDPLAALGLDHLAIEEEVA